MLYIFIVIDIVLDVWCVLVNKLDNNFVYFLIRGLLICDKFLSDGLRFLN